MLKFPVLNNHVVGVSAVALTIIGLGMAANSISQRSTRQIGEISSVQNNPHWVNPAELEPNPNSLVNEVPRNAYGSAQPTQPAEPGAAIDLGAGMKNALPAAGAKSKGWSAQEWEIASKAVSAYRAVAKAANSLTKSAPSTNNVWQSPQEISSARQQNK